MRLPRSLQKRIEARDARGFVKEARRYATTTGDAALAEYLKFVAGSVAGEPIAKQIGRLPKLVRTCGDGVPDDLVRLSRRMHIGDLQSIIWEAWCLVEDYAAALRHAVMAHAASPSGFHAALDALEARSLRGILSGCVGFVAIGDTEEVQERLHRLERALTHAAAKETEIPAHRRRRISECLRVLIQADEPAPYLAGALRALARLGYSDLLRGEVLAAASEIPRAELIAIATACKDVGLHTEILLRRDGPAAALNLLVEKVKEQPALATALSSRWKRLGEPKLLVALLEGLAGSDRAARLLSESARAEGLSAQLVDVLCNGAEEGWAPFAGATLLGLALAGRFRSLIDVSRLRRALRPDAPTEARESMIRAALSMVGVLPSNDPLFLLSLDYLARSTEPESADRVRRQIESRSRMAALAFVIMCDPGSMVDRADRLVELGSELATDTDLPGCLVALRDGMDDSDVVRVLRSVIPRAKDTVVRDLLPVLGELKDEDALSVLRVGEAAERVIRCESDLAEWPALHALALASTGRCEVVGRVLQPLVEEVGIERIERMLSAVGMSDAELNAQMVVLALAANDDRAVSYAERLGEKDPTRSSRLLPRVSHDGVEVTGLAARVYARLVSVADPRSALAFAAGANLDRPDRVALLMSVGRSATDEATVAQAIGALDDVAAVSEILDRATHRGVAGNLIADVLAKREDEIPSAEVEISFGRAYAAAARAKEAADRFLSALARSPAVASTVVQEIEKIDGALGGDLGTALFHGLLAAERDGEAMQQLRVRTDAVEIRDPVVDEALERWCREKRLPADLMVIRLKRRMLQGDWSGARKALDDARERSAEGLVEALSAAEVASASPGFMVSAIDALWELGAHTQALNASRQAAHGRGRTRIRAWLRERMEDLDDATVARAAAELSLDVGEVDTTLELLDRWATTPQSARAWLDVSKRLLELDGENGRAWLFASQLESMLGDADAAVRALERARALEAVSEREWVSRVDGVIGTCPDCVAARTALSRHFLRVRDVESAFALVRYRDDSICDEVLGIVEAAQSGFAEDLLFCSALARVYRSMPGREAQEREFLDKSIGLCPAGTQRATLLVRRGNLRLRSGAATEGAADFHAASELGALHHAEAEALRTRLAEARERQARDAGSLVRAASLLESGRVEDALRELRAAPAERDEARAQASLYLRGLCLEFMGRPVAAARAYGAILKHKDRKSTLESAARRRLARCARHLGMSVGEPNQGWSTILESEDTPSDLGPLPLQLPGRPTPRSVEQGGTS